MKPVIFTIIGNDKPGLVDKLAKTVYEYKGNWLGSSFAHMAGQFAGFVEVMVPEGEHQALHAALGNIEGLQVNVQSAPSQTQTEQQFVSFEVTGNDRPGIVHEITNVLQQFNLNIVNFNSKCESAPNWGSEIFLAKVKIALPTTLSRDELQDALEAVGNDLIVDFDIEQ